MDAAGTRTREFRRPQTGQAVSSKQAPGGRHAAMRAGRGDSGLLVSSLSSHAVTEACFLSIMPCGRHGSGHAGVRAVGVETVRRLLSLRGRAEAVVGAAHVPQICTATGSGAGE